MSTQRPLRTLFAAAAIVGLTIISGIPLVSPAAAATTHPVDIWWPVNGVQVSGSTPFKVMLEGLPVEQYQMYWQVDNGQLNPMGSNYADYPHKESQIDLSGWTWKGQGPYTINFVAKDSSGNVIGNNSTTITVANSYSPAHINSTPTPTPTPTPVATPTPVPTPKPQSSISILSPSQTQQSGQAVFSMHLENAPNSYTAYWQVDNGQLNQMNRSGDNWQSQIDLSGWTWKGQGPYTINFVAKDSSGNVIAHNSTSITVSPNSAPAWNPTPTPTPVATPTPVLSPVLSTLNSSDPLAGSNLYVNPNSAPAQWVVSNQSSDPSDASLMEKIASQPETEWFGDWNSNVYQDSKNTTDAITAAGDTPTYVLYDIPQRDCGSYSAGGASSASAYLQFVTDMANGIGNRHAAVIVEPDGLAGMDCLNQSDQNQRVSLIKDAVNILEQHGLWAYIDAGNPNWQSANTMAQRLKSAGIDQAQGFALNIANFATTDQDIAYGSAISAQVNGKHFLIDTGRNGSGPAPGGQWCNPSGRSLGNAPTTNTGQPLVDAYLWVRGPSGSDGTCNGGPSAGTFWPQYGLDLARNTNW